MYFDFSCFIITSDLSTLYSSDYSFGSLVFSNFTIVGNGNISVKQLQNSVLGCLNESICSLDKSLFHAAVTLI